MTPPPLAGRIIQDIRRERHAQLDKWGEQRHPDGTSHEEFFGAAVNAQTATQEMADAGEVSWTHILLEEVFEAFACEPDSPELREELVQACAVIVAWIEDIDSRTEGGETA